MRHVDDRGKAVFFPGNCVRETADEYQNGLDSRMHQLDHGFLAADRVI